MSPAGRQPHPIMRLGMWGARIVAAVVLIGAPLAAIVVKDLKSPNLWFDETGQYWLSSGLHHFSAPNTPSGWKHFIEYGRVFNSDPGGFTVLLRGWMAVAGTSPAALRSLPFLFLLISVIVVFLAALRCGAGPLAGTIAASAPLAFPMLLYYSTEVRAYSMEACAVVFLFFLPCWLCRDGRSHKWMFVLGCFSAVLLTSRYTALPVAAAASLAVLFPFRAVRAAVMRSAVLAVPLIVVSVTSYLVFASLQSDRAEKAIRFKELAPEIAPAVSMRDSGTVGSGSLWDRWKNKTLQSPEYTDPYLLAGKPQAEQIDRVRENLFAPAGLPLTIYLILAPLFIWFGPQSLERLRFVVRTAWVTSGLTACFTAAASLAGALPWAVNTRWSIGYQALSACCVSMTIIVVGVYVAQGIHSWKRTVPVVAVLACLLVGWSQQLKGSAPAERSYLETTAAHLQHLAAEPDARRLRFYVHWFAWPTVRYLCEAGPLQGAFDYPDRFRVESADEAAREAPILAENTDIVVLHNSSLAESYEKRIRGAAVEVDRVPPPSCLLRLRK